MKRPYLALAVLALAGSTLAGAFPLLAKAAAIFGSQPLDPSRFSVLARPVGNSDWNLVVLKQRAAKPQCWQERNDGQVDSTLTRLDFSAACAQYTDSNGYSLRIDGEELVSNDNLQVRQVGQELQLLATSNGEPTTQVVGRGDLSKRERNAFVALQLEPGWELLRRSRAEQTLNHLYFSHNSSFGELLADSDNEGVVASQGDSRDDDLQTPSRLLEDSSQLNPEETDIATASRSPLSAVEEERLTTLAAKNSMSISSNLPIPLKVIPFRE